MEDVLLITGLAGVVVIAVIEKFCEEHGLPQYAATMKALLPIGAVAAFIAAVEVVL